MTKIILFWGTLLLGTSAFAQVSGHLTLVNCPGDAVTFNMATIDWLPAGGGTGCIQTGVNANVTFFGGTLGAGVTGLIKDLNTTTTILPLDRFMTFSGTSLDFTLTALGPGPVNTSCATVLDPNLPACAPFAGSPLILAPSSTGTAITLSASGTVTDAGPAPASKWVGAFTSQISSATPAQIQASILAGQPVTSTYSGDFIITPATPSSTTGRMTGGGSFFTPDGIRVTHGFELHCSPSILPNNLEINWLGNQFHLNALVSVNCFNDPSFSAGQPFAGFNTMIGSGTGTYNHQPATIQFIFTDAGEPGTRDKAGIVIVSGSTTFSVPATFLDNGNQQAHK